MVNTGSCQDIPGGYIKNEYTQVNRLSFTRNFQITLVPPNMKVQGYSQTCI